MISSDSVKATRVRLGRLRSVLWSAAGLAFLLYAAYSLGIERKSLEEVIQFTAVGLAVASLLVLVTFYFMGLALNRLGYTLESVSSQNQRLAALQRIVHALNATLDLDELLGLVLHESVAASGALGGQILLAEADGSLEVAVRAPPTESGPPGVAGPGVAGPGVAGPGTAGPGAAAALAPLVVRAAQSGRTQVLADLAAEPGYVRLDPHARSAIAVPIRRGVGVIGVIQLEAARPGGFGAQSAAPLDELVEHAAVAINNARLFNTLERQLAESAMLVEVARSVSGSANLIEVLQAVVEKLRSALDYPRIAIYLREGEMLFQAAQTGFDPARCRLRLGFHEGLVGRAARTTQPQFVRDVRGDADYLPAAEDTRSAIALPLLREGEVSGVITVEAPAGQPLTASDLDLLGHLAPQIAVAIENARLHMEQAGRLRIMAALYESTRDLLTELDLDRLMHTLAERAALLADATTVVVYRLRPEGGVLEMGAARGLPLHLVSTRLALGEGLSGRVAESGQPLVVDDYANWPGRAPLFASVGFRACAAVPMRSSGTILGVITVANIGSPATFAPEAVQLLELFANQAAAAVANAQLYLTEQQRRRTSEALREVGRVVSSSLDVDEVFQLILQQLERVLPYDSSTIMLGDAAGLEVAACRGFEQPEQVVATRYRPSHGGLLFAVLATRQPSVIADVRREPDWPRHTHVLDAQRSVRAWIGVPMVTQDRVVGMLTVASHEPAFYRAEDGQIAQVFAEQAASAIRNARLYAETQAKLAELRLLYDVAVATTSAASVDEILKRTIAQIQEALDISHVAVLLLDPDQQVLHVRAAAGFPPGRAEGFRLRVGEGVAGRVAQDGRPRRVPDVRSEPDYLEIDPAVRSALYMPLALGSQTIGVLLAESVRPAAFREADLRLLGTMAGQLAAIIANAQLLDVLVASQQQLAERNRALQEANLRLQELDRLKSQFLANMSHELRTPLNSIIGFAEVLADSLAGPLNTEQDEYVSYIHSSGGHLLNLINDVLDLSKIDAGKMKLELRPFAVAELFAEAQTTIAPLLGRREQRLRLDVADGLPAVTADAFRVKQVLLNLLSNAHKFTPDGGVIRLEARLRDPETVLLSVIDTGPGIQPEYQQVIFEEFRQADSGLTREFEGTGLGLTICKRLVELHGGQIWVESEYGHGAAFCLVLPLHGPGGAARRAVQPARTVLIVEDDPQFAHLLGVHLRRAGYEPSTVHSGADAVPFARRLRPRLITLDIMLPDLSGWSVLETLKSDPELRDIPVLVISVIDDPERAFSLGAIDYLVKPFDRAALLAALERVQVAEAAGPPVEVLVVDGDPAVGGLLAGMLPAERYHVRHALGVERALALLAERRPHLAILNLVLYNGDAAQLLDALRANGSQPEVPVLALADRLQDEAERGQLSEQIRAFMSRSTLTRDELLAEVRRLEQFHARHGERAAHGSVRVS
jgi:signal transduction histidine kinase/DNA-binding response OmpR family regulator